MKQLTIGKAEIGEAESNIAGVADYAKLAKPGIVGLTLVAALTGIYFANDGQLPHWPLIAVTFLTLGLATAGACVLNNVYDRDIDRVMGRTASRVLAAGTASARAAFIASLLLIVPSIAVMAILVNPVAAWLTAFAVFGYSVVYTMWAKRRTPWANQIGGVAGAMPPVIGYAAVAGHVGIEGLILFAIMVLWQQPHALSLALKYRKDYARAAVPVVPVARGVRSTKWRILIYCLLLLPVSTLPYAFAMAGLPYLMTAAVLGLIFIAMSVRFLRSERSCDMRIFAYSIVYLIVLFAALVADARFGLA